MTSSLIGAEAADPGAKAPNVLLSREQGSSILNAGIINLGLGEPWLFVRYTGSVIPAISSGKRAESAHLAAFREQPRRSNPDRGIAATPLDEPIVWGNSAQEHENA